MLKRKDAPEGEETPAAVRPKVDAGSAIVPPEEDAVIEELVRQREEKRANKEWDAADVIRNQLQNEHDVKIKDDFQIWRCGDGRVGLCFRFQRNGDPQPLNDAQITTMLESREEARKSHDWARADKIRDVLKSNNVNLDDKSRCWNTPDGRRGAYRPLGGAGGGGSYVGQMHPPQYGAPQYGAPQYAAPQYFQPPVAPMQQAGGSVEDLVNHRETLRHQKQWQQADVVRDQLRSMGVTLDEKNKKWSCTDGRSGTIPNWPATAPLPAAAAPPPLSQYTPPSMPAYGQGMAGGSNPLVEDLVKQREQLRHSNQWQQADMVRDQLRSMGIQLDDKNKTWSCSDGSSGTIPSWNEASSADAFGVPSAVPPYMPAPSMPPSMPPYSMSMPAYGQGMPAYGQAQAARGGQGGVEDLVKQREQLRHSNQWQQADMVRDQLRSMGVTLDDKNKKWSCTDGSSGTIPSWNDV